MPNVDAMVLERMMDALTQVRYENFKPKDSPKPEP
jgi:hypothetical protein